MKSLYLSTYFYLQSWFIYIVMFQSLHLCLEVPCSHLSTQNLSARSPWNDARKTNATSQSFVRSDFLCLAHEQSTESYPHRHTDVGTFLIFFHLYLNFATTVAKSKCRGSFCSDARSLNKRDEWPTF